MQRPADRVQLRRQRSSDNKGKTACYSKAGMPSGRKFAAETHVDGSAWTATADGHGSVAHWLWALSRGWPLAARRRASAA